MKWNRLWAASFAALLLALLVSWDNRPVSADSPSATTTNMVELWREIPGYEPSGIGSSIRAHRLFPGQVFTDHVVVSNIDSNKAKSVGGKIGFQAYWSTATLAFVGWEGENWTFGPNINYPDRYVAEYQGDLAIGQKAELKVTFEVKKPSHWPTNVLNPQAQHSIDYLLFPAQTADHQLLSDLVPVNTNTAYGWSAGIGNFEFVQANLDGTNARPRLLAGLSSAYKVQSYDADLPSTFSAYASTSAPCETQIQPDIRTGEVLLIQGTCKTVPPSNKWTYVPDGVRGRLIDKDGLYGFLGNPVSTIWGWYTIKPAENGALAIQAKINPRATKPEIDIRIQEGHNAQVELVKFEPSVGLRSLTLSVWNSPTGWKFTEGTIKTDNFVEQSLWDWNLHLVRFTPETIVYNETVR